VTEVLGDMISEHVQGSNRHYLSLAENIYLRCLSHKKVVACMVRQGRCRRAVEYSREKAHLTVEEYAGTKNAERRAVDRNEGCQSGREGLVKRSVWGSNACDSAPVPRYPHKVVDATGEFAFWLSGCEYSVFLVFPLSVCLYLCLSVLCLSLFYLSLSRSLSVSLCVSLSLCLSFYVSACPSVCLSVCLSVCTSLSLSLWKVSPKAFR